MSSPGTSQDIYDVAIIGAGAAGLMCAIACRKAPLRVLLLDSKEKIGAKILMSGGTRCNVTNDKITDQDFESEEPRIVQKILRAFPSTKTVEFFDELGVKMVMEEGGKYFPVTHSGRTVLEALMQRVQDLEISLKSGKKVTSLERRGELFEIRGEGFAYLAKTVVLTTGGLSYPQTGSDGTGYGLAEVLGHTLVSTSPALTPLTTNDPDWQALTGLSMPVRLDLWCDGKKHISYEGAFLFTHFGFSGPVVLDISRHWIRLSEKHQVKLVAHFLVGMNESEFRDKILQESKSRPTKQLKHWLAQIFPEGFVSTFLKKLQIVPNTLLGQLPRSERELLIRSLCYFPLTVNGTIGYKKAEVTAGGVSLSEINSATMESKKSPGLFLAGEILDVDGRIGGFNFQWAWASAQVAASGVVKKIRP